MRHLWTVAALLAAGGVLWPATAEFPARRTALAKSLPDGAIVLFAPTDRESEDDRTGFHQEPNFYYLSGWQEPGAILLVAPAADILFLPRPDARRERYTGRMTGPDDPGATAAAGFANVLPVERFESELRRALERVPRIYTVGDSHIERLRRAEPLREVSSAAPAIACLRMIKSPAELELIRQAVDATVEAHRAAWKRAAPGMYEYQVAAAMVEAYTARGCERSAYPPIVAAGPNGTILHYWKNRRRIDKGELLLMDVGAECAGYAADVTRTVPVGTKFTARQRALYEVVLGSEKAAIAAVKPGIKLAELTAAARAYMDAHGGFGKYLPHGVSHHVGLEVHDAADLSVPLAEGMVVTVEPGVYIPEEHIGIRIEDMVLVTKDGAKVLTNALPREPGEIERAIGR